ncbi:MAG: DUF4160 domain-containing protein [Syntrophobacteraceae bacterium]|nr:DUF4160 domain-containing protein [Syntrophobacteraceae bacterium]
MPSVCQFFGIVIYMYYNDHNPPHFHAEYTGGEVLINIQTLRVISGSISRRAHAMVIEWADQHRTELMANWERARRAEALVQIEPLE